MSGTLAVEGKGLQVPPPSVAVAESAAMKEASHHFKLDELRVQPTETLVRDTNLETPNQPSTQPAPISESELRELKLIETLNEVAPFENETLPSDGARERARKYFEGVASDEAHIDLSKALSSDEALEEILNLIYAPHIPGRLWLFDYDGTLTDIVDDPEKAAISRRAAELLRALSHLEHDHVAIVSGRSVETLMHFLKDILVDKEELPRASIVLVGLHGGQVYDLRDPHSPGKWIKQPDPQIAHTIVDLKESWKEWMSPSQARLDAMTADDRLKAELIAHALTGVTLEDKMYTLAIHYRRVGDIHNGEVESPAQIRARNVVEYILEIQREGGLIIDSFHVKKGKMVREIIPKSFQKGEGVVSVMEIFNGALEEGVLPIMLGDDLTDNDGFKKLREPVQDPKVRKGITIFVGKEGDPMPDAAITRIDNPTAVHTLIERAIERSTVINDQNRVNEN